MPNVYTRGLLPPAELGARQERIIGGKNGLLASGLTLDECRNLSWYDRGLERFYEYVDTGEARDVDIEGPVDIVKTDSVDNRERRRQKQREWVAAKRAADKTLP